MFDLTKSKYLDVESLSLKQIKLLSEDRCIVVFKDRDIGCGSAIVVSKNEDGELELSPTHIFTMHDVTSIDVEVIDSHNFDMVIVKYTANGIECECALEIINQTIVVYQEKEIRKSDES